MVHFVQVIIDASMLAAANEMATDRCGLWSSLIARVLFASFNIGGYLVLS